LRIIFCKLIFCDSLFLLLDLSLGLGLGLEYQGKTVTLRFSINYCFILITSCI
jgi:hypothetical protein